MTMEGTTNIMAGLIPVVVTGGILLKFSEAIVPTRSRVLGTKGSKKRTKNIYGRNFSGDFSNVGY